MSSVACLSFCFCMHVLSLHCVFFSFFCNFCETPTLIFLPREDFSCSCLNFALCCSSLIPTPSRNCSDFVGSLYESESSGWGLGPSAVYCQEDYHGKDPLSALFLLIMHPWDWQYKLHLNLGQGKSIHFLKMTPLPAYGTRFSVKQAKWNVLCLDPSSDGWNSSSARLCFLLWRKFSGFKGFPGFTGMSMVFHTMRSDMSLWAGLSFPNMDF